MKLVTGGAPDRHRTQGADLRGGAPWVPFIGDRMNEGYRQHHMFVRPVLSALPKEILYRQVYTSFQHDETAPAALWAMGYQNVMWGSDYPHIEGTLRHTQKTLQSLRRGRAQREPPHPDRRAQGAVPARGRPAPGLNGPTPAPRRPVNAAPSGARARSAMVLRWIWLAPP